MNILHEFFGDPLKHAQKGKQAKTAATTSDGRQSQAGLLRSAFSLILATGAAYAFSVAVDFGVGGLIGIYPPTTFLPAVTWSIISAVLIFVALLLSRFSRWLALPYAAFGTLAFLGGLVGTHPHNFIVAAAMFLHTYFVRKGCKPASKPIHTRKAIETQIERWIGEVRMNPKDFETMAAIGSAYGKLGQHQKAIEFFHKALEINPSYADGYLGMAAAYGFLGRPDDKIALCLKAISLNPSSAEAYGNLGSALGKVGRYEESIQASREAIRLKPDFADAHFALGLAHLSCGDQHLALEQSTQLEQIDPSLAKQLRDLIKSVNKA